MSKSSDYSWLEQLPDIDRQALTNLCDGNFELLGTPREMVFSLYEIPDIRQIESLTHELEQAGFAVEAFNDPNHAGLYIIEAKKMGYIINETNYTQDKKMFENIAKLYGIHYDGWYASK